MPLSAAGWRMEPPASEPKLSGTLPAATAAPGPPLAAAGTGRPAAPGPARARLRGDGAAGVGTEAQRYAPRRPRRRGAAAGAAGDRREVPRGAGHLPGRALGGRRPGE